MNVLRGEFSVFLSLMALLVFSSCDGNGTRRTVQLKAEMPTAYSSPRSDLPLPQEWWTGFGRADLQSLIERAFSDNLDLKVAWARLQQANALATQAGAGRFPTLDGTGSATRQRTVADATTASTAKEISVGERVSTVSKSYALGLSSSFELDLWGRVRNSTAAARLSAEASRQDVEAAAISLAAEVTLRWLGILEARATRRLLSAQLKTHTTYLELVELRFRKSLVSALDVYQQRQAVEKIKAELPLWEASEQLLKHQLALLLGKAPQAEVMVDGEALPKATALPDVGIPADLLTRRPDVRAALLRLLAADRSTAAARADRLPAIRLTGSVSYTGNQTSELFESWMSNLAAGLTAPIIDGGRKRAEVQRQRAIVEERLAGVRKNLLIAMREVEDALVRERQHYLHIAALKTRLKVAQDTLREARERYQKGLVDYLNVLTALDTVHTLEQNLIKRQAEVLTYRVALYRALGGSWAQSLRPQGISSAQVPRNVSPIKQSPSLENPS